MNFSQYRSIEGGRRAAAEVAQKVEALGMHTRSAFERACAHLGLPQDQDGMGKLAAIHGRAWVEACEWRDVSLAYEHEVQYGVVVAVRRRGRELDEKEYEHGYELR